MAGFLIPFGQALGEFGAGLGKGNEVREDLRWKKLNNDLLQQQLQYGGPAALKLYMKSATQRSKNLEIGQQWAQRAQQIATTNPLQAQKWQMASQELMGIDGMGSLEDPIQVALNLGIRQPDVMADLAKARYYATINPPVKPIQVQQLDANGMPTGVMGWAGLTQQLNPAFGERTLGTSPLPDIGAGTVSLPSPGISAPPAAPPPMGPLPTGGGMTEMDIPPGGAPETLPGGMTPQAFKKLTLEEQQHYIEALNRGGGLRPGGGAVPAPSTAYPAPPAAGATASSTAPSTTPSAAPGTAPTTGGAPSSPTATGLSVPKVWGGDPGGIRMARPKPSPRDMQAVDSLAGAQHQMEEFSDFLHSIPPNQRFGSLGSHIHRLGLFLGFSSDTQTDKFLSQLGITLTALVQGFLGASQTRAYAAIKLVQDHYPQYGDSVDLAIHKLDQLNRPDGYIQFAKLAILMGPQAAAMMTPIREPRVLPPAAIDDMRGGLFRWPDGTIGGRYEDGQIYWKDPTDGYWVQKNYRRK